MRIGRPKKSLGDTELNPEGERVFLSECRSPETTACQADGTPIILVPVEAAFARVEHAAGVFKNTVWPPRCSQAPDSLCGLACDWEARFAVFSEAGTVLFLEGLHSSF